MESVLSEEPSTAAWLEQHEHGQRDLDAAAGVYHCSCGAVWDRVRERSMVTGKGHETLPPVPFVVVTVPPGTLEKP